MNPWRSVAPRLEVLWLRSRRRYSGVDGGDWVSARTCVSSVSGTKKLDCLSRPRGPYLHVAWLLCRRLPPCEKHLWHDNSSANARAGQRERQRAAVKRVCRPTVTVQCLCRLRSALLGAGGPMAAVTRAKLGMPLTICTPCAPPGWAAHFKTQPCALRSPSPSSPQRHSLIHPLTPY
jgi:hypothetical protein